MYTLLIEMANITSPNTPILHKILERLDKIDNRLDKLEVRVGTLEKTVNNIQSYIKNESDIQENRLTLHMKELLHGIYNTANIQSSLLKEFYTPSSNKILTDLDGCLIVKSHSGPVRVRNSRTGMNRNIMFDRVYIIEAKHGLTKSLIDKKLEQFCIILDTFQKIHTGVYTPKNIPDTKFDNMVLSYDLQDFPEDIYFMFASDDLSEDLRNFLILVNNGDVTESKYNEYQMKNLKSHLIISDILNDTSVGGIMKSQLNDAKTIEDIYALFTTPKKSSNSTNKYLTIVEEHRHTIMPYKSRLLSLLVPYSSVSSCYSTLKGKIGFRWINQVMWPDNTITEF